MAHRMKWMEDARKIVMMSDDRLNILNTTMMAKTSHGEDRMIHDGSWWWIVELAPLNRKILGVILF